MRLYASSIHRKKATRHRTYDPKPRKNWTTWKRVRCEDGSYQSARCCGSCGGRWLAAPPTTCREPRHAERFKRNGDLRRLNRPGPWSIRKRCLSCLQPIYKVPRDECSEPRHRTYAQTRQDGRSFSQTFIGTRLQLKTICGSEPLTVEILIQRRGEALCYLCRCGKILGIKEETLPEKQREAIRKILASESGEYPAPGSFQ